MEKKIVYAIDAVVLVGTLMGIFFAYSTLSDSGVGLSPEENPWFFKYENCRGDCWIFVDDNPVMNTPNEFYVEDALKITLEPGTYYWRIQGTFEEQEVVKLTLLQRTEFYVYADDETYYMYVNAGVEISGGINE